MLSWHVFTRNVVMSTALPCQPSHDGDAMHKLIVFRNEGSGSGWQSLEECIQGSVGEGKPSHPAALKQLTNLPQFKSQPISRGPMLGHMAVCPKLLGLKGALEASGPTVSRP